MIPAGLELLDELLTPSARVAVGLDYAASEENWGLCVLVLADGLDDARLALLLPAAGPRSTRHPSAALLGEVLERVERRGCAASVAVDVPFGWPVECLSFLSAWRASGVDPASVVLPDRKHFEWRLTDRVFYERLGARPLSVSADALGQAAFAWARTRQELGSRLGTVDVGLGEREVRGVQMFETYPAAFVRSHAGGFKNYKKRPEVRRKLLEQLLGTHRVANRERWEAALGWAVEQKGSPDACDALLCALLGWAHLRWRAGQPDAHLTRPEVWLGAEGTRAEADRIAREGWMLIPWSRGGSG